MQRFRSVVVNAGWNLAGNLLPLAAAVVAMPYLASRLGTERFGLLTLGWVLVGYFGLFDFGLGRALTKLVAERAGHADDAETASLCSTGTALALAAGVAGALLVAAGSAWAGDWLSDDTPGLRAEAAAGLLVIALGIAPTVSTAALRGVLEGLQRFRLLMFIRTPAGIASFVAPCISAAFTPRLEWALAALVLTRWLLFAAHWWACRGAMRLTLAAARRAWVAPMLRLGGWMTVSNVVGPVIVYADRIVIGALVSAAALAYYAVPFELVSRLLVLPVALSGALFPALAAARAAGLGGERRLRRRALQLTAAAVLPLALTGALLAAPLLQAWMGPDFAVSGSLAMQILLAGFVSNSLAQIPFAALQGRGLARQTAMLHLTELPLYLALLLLLVRSHGIEGAAAAWALRGTIDYAALSWLVQRDDRRNRQGRA